MKIVLRCGIKTASLSSWVVVCHKAWPKLTFFLSYPWSCWPEAATEPRTDHSSVFQRLLPEKALGKRWGMTESRPPGPFPQLLSTQSPHKRFWKGSFLKNPFFGGEQFTRNKWLTVYLTIFLLWWWHEAHRLTPEHSLRFQMLVSLPSFRKDNLENF